MVYIVSINPKGFSEYAQESVHNTYKDALLYLDEFDKCHGTECEYRLYEAINEYTNKRHLLLER